MSAPQMCVACGVQPVREWTTPMPLNEHVTWLEAMGRRALYCADCFETLP